eukprot:TRINITY_DN8053_c0_g1_i1.p1 TRINITY_DN8053_c0_g1~~TRINITY_DN8053_c0_g1_i1.p1  ORF type:complete len:303 (-),score=73.34 TRINITY_DN8053_c0_g1_i1:4-912(-)
MDLLVELEAKVHFFMNPGRKTATATECMEVFRQIFESIDKLEKVLSYMSPDLQMLIMMDPTQKSFLIEQRQTKMVTLCANFYLDEPVFIENLIKNIFINSFDKESSVVHACCLLLMRELLNRNSLNKEIENLLLTKFQTITNNENLEFSLVKLQQQTSMISYIDPETDLTLGDLFLFAVYESLKNSNILTTYLKELGHFFIIPLIRKQLFKEAYIINAECNAFDAFFNKCTYLLGKSSSVALQKDCAFSGIDFYQMFYQSGTKEELERCEYLLYSFIGDNNNLKVELNCIFCEIQLDPIVGH